MKQLKFMLAAATAFGIATAAQAGTPYTGFPDNFDSATAGAAATTLTGYDFKGTAGDDESVVQAGGYNQSANALKVNTGTEPLLRAIDYSTAANAVELDKSKAVEKINSLTIDTMVQFTVTPKGDTVTSTTGDKLLIYLKETDAGNVLTVKAAKFAVGDELAGTIDTFEEMDVPVSAEGLAVEANTWYNLKVTTKLDAGFPVFEIFVNDKQLISSVVLYDAEGKLFPSLQGKGSTSLTYVGFAGEGLVDDLVVSRELDAPSSVDFTLTLGTGVSAVSWTVNGEAQSTEGGKFTADSGTTLTVAINSVTYADGYAGTEDWTKYTYAKAESGSVEITAKKFAEVSEGGVVTPTDDTVKDVTTGSFTVPEATDDNTEAVAAAKADLAKALTWATSKGGKSYNDAITAINGMNFADATETDVEQAYLLNCDPNNAAELKTAKDNFKFEASDLTKLFDVDNTDALSFDSKNYNGTVILEGKGELSGEWEVKAVGHKFFRARLVK